MGFEAREVLITSRLKALGLQISGTIKIDQFHYRAVERLKGDQTKIREYLHMEDRKTVKDNYNF